MAKMTRVAVAAAALLACGVSTARADCGSDIQRMLAQVTRVGDARVRKLVQFDIERARREADEGDADECEEAVEHADKLLASAGPVP